MCGLDTHLVCVIICIYGGEREREREKEREREREMLPSPLWANRFEMTCSPLLS